MALHAAAEALLIDLDGVLRRWDPTWNAAVEERYGLPASALAETAFEWDRFLAAVSGQVTHEQWMAGVAQALAAAHPGVDAPTAVALWQTYHGEVDVEVLAFVREVRSGGVPVALVTNATDKLDADLAALKLSREVDAVVNSSVLGTHKPTAEFFAAACAAVGTPPGRCLFVDDSDRHVRAARVAGLSAYRWNGVKDVPYLRAALGLGRPRG